MNTERRLRILLVEDDAIFAAVTAEVMRERALVRWTPTAESAIAAAGEKDWDLIITDIELPGMSGLELVMKIKAAQPHVATLILTGHRSFDNAVEAIRVGADDFLTKPVDRRTLIEKIDELAALSARRKAASSAAVLAIGAHPDDIEVGSGGTLLGHVAQGHEVSMLVLTGGDVAGIPADRTREATRAAELMGVRLFHVNLADSSVTEGGATFASRWEGMRWTKPLLVIACLTAFSFALDPLGFLLSAIPLMPGIFLRPNPNDLASDRFLRSSRLRRRVLLCERVNSCV